MLDPAYFPPPNARVEVLTDRPGECPQQQRPVTPGPAAAARANALAHYCQGLRCNYPADTRTGEQV